MSLQKPRISQCVGHDGGIAALALGSYASPFHHTIATGGYDGLIGFYDARVISSQNNTVNQDDISTKNHHSTQSFNTPEGSITSIIFGEGTLGSFPSSNNTIKTTAKTNDNTDQSSVSDDTTNNTPLLRKDIFQEGEYSFFTAIDNIVYQYDLRKITPKTINTTNTQPTDRIVQQHIALSTPQEDTIGFITLSPDGRYIAMTTDDDRITYVPLTHLPNVARCINNEVMTFNHEEQYRPENNIHTNIPTNILFDPLNPLSTLSSPYNQFYTTYTVGMDYMMNTITTPQQSLHQYSYLKSKNQHPLPTLAPLTGMMVNDSTLLDQALQEKQKTGGKGQVFNPPFINAGVMTPDANTLVYAMGDGQIALYAIEREAPVSYTVYNQLLKKKSEGKLTSKDTSSYLNYLQYIDLLISLYSSSYIAAPFSTHLPTNIGKYRGHMHSVVGVNIPAFLTQSTQNTALIKMWGNHLHARKNITPVGTGIGKKWCTFSNLFTMNEDPTTQDGVEFFSQQEQQTLTASLRGILAQQYKAYPTTTATSPQPNQKPAAAKGKGKQPQQQQVHNFNRDFSSLNHLLTCGLDQSLIMWKNIGSESSFVYNVSRQQQHLVEQQQETQQEAEMLKNKKLTTAQRTTIQNQFKQHRTLVATQQQQLQQHYEQLADDIINDKLETTTSTTLDSTQAMIEADLDEIYDLYQASILNHYREDVNNQKKAYKADNTPNLLSGLYKKVSEQENKILDSDYIALRMPLGAKPNAMITDRIGNVYIADSSKKVTVMNLLQEVGE